MGVYDEYTNMQNAVKAKRVAGTGVAGDNPEATGELLKMSLELHQAKQQLRTLRDAMRAAKLLPAEIDLAREAFVFAITEHGGSLIDDEGLQLVSVSHVAGGHYKDPSIVLDVAFAPPSGGFSTPRGIFIEEIASFFAGFRRRVFDAYAAVGGDTELNIRLCRLDLAMKDSESVAKWDAFELHRSVPAAAEPDQSSTFGPQLKAKAKSL